MNLEAILESYRNNNRLEQLAERIAMSDSDNIQLKGLSGSATAFIIGAFSKNQTDNHVIVLNDKEEAAYFQNDLVNITREFDVFYFPDSFKKTGVFDVMNSSHVMLRTEALMKLVSKESKEIHRKILVTYPEALFEKVTPPATFSSSMIKIKMGKKLDLDSLLERMVKLGFESTDFVYEPGQFSMRGDILDIYSYGNDKPYRLELFGDEVESIRLFDPVSQLSERRLKKVTLIPDLNKEQEKNDLLSEDKEALFRFLPDNTVWWFKDPNYVLEITQKMNQKFASFLEKNEEGLVQIKETSVDRGEEKAISLRQKDFVSKNVLEEFLNHHKIVAFHVPEGRQHDYKETFTFDIIPQPVFNRKFELLIEDLSGYASKRYAIFIFAENPKQLKRIDTIFKDLNAKISFYQVPVPLSKGFIDHQNKFICYTDHEIFQRYHKYKVKQAYSKNKALTLKTLRELQPGDFVTHIDHGVGVYSGLQKLETDGVTQEAVRIRYKNNDLLYVNINSLYKISKYSGKEGTVPRVNKLGSDTWQKLKNKTKKKVKDIAKDLIKLYAARKSERGFSHQPDTYLQNELEASFIFEDTPDQAKTTLAVKKDMESERPMDRLVCGDVGFGKTEIAIRAAFKTLIDGKQAAIMVPTTILAYQHYQTFSERLKEFPCTISYLNRFKTAKEKRETLQALAEGKVDIIIGTHALLNKKVKFNDLGVLIVDEEQKFGVT
ncbi:MAG TPA: DEAD/DEAH box helicase, partial [Chitinophagaceae bacterium]|nr:DEAD/DEAH box helicase [Chitinophagaceae bacterium]